MGERSNAWLLTLGAGHRAAVADHEMIEYVAAPRLHAVPMAPSHCANVLFWQDRILPVLDIGAFLDGGDAAAAPLAVVLAYQTRPREPLRYVALALEQPPVRVEVDDEQACALPEEHRAFWKSAALACFSLEGGVPILDVAGVCAWAVGDAPASVRSAASTAGRNALEPQMDADERGD